MLSAGVDFAVFNDAILWSIGVETDLVVGFKPLRADGIEGCLGVVPLPFDLRDDGDGRVDGVAVVPFVML